MDFHKTKKIPQYFSIFHISITVNSNNFNTRALLLQLILKSANEKELSALGRSIASGRLYEERPEFAKY
jgi:hypothetical protein